MNSVHCQLPRDNKKPGPNQAKHDPGRTQGTLNLGAAAAKMQRWTLAKKPGLAGLFSHPRRRNLSVVTEGAPR
jgi:hypothetical protein